MRYIVPRREGNHRSFSVDLCYHIYHDNASTAFSSGVLKDSKTSANYENIWKGSSGTNKSDAMTIRTEMGRAASVHASGPGRAPSYSGSRTMIYSMELQLAGAKCRSCLSLYLKQRKR